jgi:hypothetical protein
MKRLNFSILFVYQHTVKYRNKFIVNKICKISAHNILHIMSLKQIEGQIIEIPYDAFLDNKNSNRCFGDIVAETLFAAALVCISLMLIISQLHGNAQFLFGYGFHQIPNYQNFSHNMVQFLGTTLKPQKDKLHLWADCSQK